MARTYQTHSSDARGISDSANKLGRLHLPGTLTGKRFLDIGCNEGYFCHIAAQRGAARVVGMDMMRANLDFAAAHYPDPAIEWRHQSWQVLPEGPYDVILWSSGMHYERDPAAMMQRIAAQLAPGGLFVLECGIAAGGPRDMALVHRQADSR